MRHSKKLAALAIAAGVAITATAALAWWTTEGSGSGSAAVGTSTANLTVTASPDAGEPALIPGGAAVELQLAVDNPNTFSASLKDLNVSIVPDSVKCGSAAVDDAWFSIVEDTISAGDIIPPDGEAVVVASSGVTLRMNDDALASQNVCKSTNVSFNLLVSEPTP